MELTKCVSHLIKLFFFHQQDVLDPSKITRMALYKKTDLETFHEILDITNYSELIKVSSKQEIRLSKSYTKWLKKEK